MTPTRTWNIRRLALVAVATAPLTLLGACNGMGMGMPGETAVRAMLIGTAEVPGPGDSDGTGRAMVRMTSAMPTQVCYDVSVSRIATASAAHIHRGEAGVAGPVVVTLMAPATGTSSGCVDVTAALAAEMLANPGGFYANVHNAEFPAGAVRGQLGR